MTKEIVSLFCNKWGRDASWRVESDDGPHEAKFLKLDCSKIENILGWKPVWDIEKAVEKTVEWTKVYLNGHEIECEVDRQIKEYYECYMQR